MFEKIKQIKDDVMLGASILAKDGIGAWKEFLADRRAQTGTIMTIVTGSITVMLGLIIFVSVRNAMPVVNDTAANATMSSVSTIFYSAIGLVVSCISSFKGSLRSKNRLPSLSGRIYPRSRRNRGYIKLIFMDIYALNKIISLCDKDYEELEAGAIRRTFFAPSFFSDMTQ